MHHLFAEITSIFRLILDRRATPVLAPAEEAPPCALPADALPVLSPDGLLSARRELVNRIEELAGTTRPHFERYYLSALRRYAAWAQQLPASEAHHHAHPGGLLDHGLEVAVAALRVRQGHLLPPGAPPEEAVLKKDVWTYAVFTLALLHDAAKPAVDQRVTLFNGGGASLVWNPWEGAIGGLPGVKGYQVGFRRGRDYQHHQRASLMLAPALVGAPGLAWLQTEPAAFSAWLAYASDDPAQAGPLASILAKADGESVARSLGAAAPSHAAGTPAPLHERLRAALRHLIDSGELPLNRRGAVGWRCADDLWLVSKTAMDALRADLLRTGQVGVPADNARLFDVFQDHGLLVPNAEGKAIWRMTVAVGGQADTLTLIRVPVAVLWPDPEAAPGLFGGTVGPLPAPAKPAAADADPVVPADGPERAGETVPVDGPAPGGNPATVAPSPAAPPQANLSLPSLGQAFLDWMIDGLRAGRLEYNTAKARIHVVPEGALLASPGIFKDYAAQSGAGEFEPVQKSFLKLKLHAVTTGGMNIHRYAVSGSGSVISGLLVPEAGRLFGALTPEPNPRLIRQ